MFDAALARLRAAQRNAKFNPGDRVAIRLTGQTVEVVEQRDREVRVTPDGKVRWTYLAEHLRPLREDACPLKQGD